jgi:glucose/arabinose dehydrogenase
MVSGVWPEASHLAPAYRLEGRRIRSTGHTEVRIRRAYGASGAAAALRRLAFTSVPILVVGLVVSASASALSLEEIGTYEAPTFVTSDPGDPDRIFVVERAGRIQLTRGDETTPYLDIEPLVLSPPEAGAENNEGGLFSVAFSPEFAIDELFYVSYRAADDPDTSEDESGDWRLDEFRANGDAADPTSRREVLTIEYSGPLDKQLHYGGQLQFGPDGYLYASTGDGGPQGDPNGNAQNPENLHGKILRIDPRGSAPGEYSVPQDNPFAGATAGADEIWSYGLRNPWRFSFDRLTGALAIGDVGSSSWEEVNFEAGVDPAKGDNFGWNCLQGTHPFKQGPPCDSLAPSSLTPPVFEYAHEPWPGNCSVTGGYVVRDTSLGDLYGRYLYGDWCAGELRSLDFGPPVVDRSEGLEPVELLTSFGEDSSCRIYVVSLSGPVYRLIEPGSAGACPQAAPAPSGPAPTEPSPTPEPTYPPEPTSPPPRVDALCERAQVTILGTTGPEVLRGTAGRDIIAGRAGDDTIRGFGGKDIICGGRGSDTVRGGSRDDRLRGGPGRDDLFGGTGSDVCDGGTAVDTASLCTVERRL